MSETYKGGMLFNDDISKEQQEYLSLLVKGCFFCVSVRWEDSRTVVWETPHLECLTELGEAIVNAHRAEGVPLTDYRTSGRPS